LIERRETGLLHARRVLADRQRRRAELSGIAGSQLSHEAGTGVGDRDGRAGDDSAVRIEDRPADRTGTELRLSQVCRRGRRQADDADQDGDYFTHGRSPPGNQLIFSSWKWFLWNKKRSLNQACKIAVSPGSIAC